MRRKEDVSFSDRSSIMFLQHPTRGIRHWDGEMWVTECIPRTRLRGAKSTNEASGTGLASSTDFFRPDQRHRSQLYFVDSPRATSKQLVAGRSFVIADGCLMPARCCARTIVTRETRPNCSCNEASRRILEGRSCRRLSPGNQTCHSRPIRLGMTDCIETGKSPDKDSTRPLRLLCWNRLACCARPIHESMGHRSAPLRLTRVVMLVESQTKPQRCTSSAASCCLRKSSDRHPGYGKHHESFVGGRRPWDTLSRHRSARACRAMSSQEEPRSRVIPSEHRIGSGGCRLSQTDNTWPLLQQPRSYRAFCVSASPWQLPCSS